MYDPIDFGATGLIEGLHFGHRVALEVGWATGASLVERRQQLLDRAGRRPSTFATMGTLLDIRGFIPQ
jgi:hypothetical protein